MVGSGGRRCLCEPARPRSACRKQGRKPASPKAENHFHFCRHGASSIQSAPVHSRRIATKPSNETNPSTNLHPLCLRQLFPTLIEFILCLGKSSGAPTGRPILFCPNNISLPSPSRTHQPFSHLTDLISHHNELLRSTPEQYPEYGGYNASKVGRW